MEWIGVGIILALTFVAPIFFVHPGLPGEF